MIQLILYAMFVDEAVIDVTGGKGGDGCVAWRREKYIPYGGPAGGDGGDGGDVAIQADENADTLSDFAARKRFAAKAGEKGHGKGMNGHRGEDLLLHVPPGTMVMDAESQNMLADLVHHGDRAVVARGGRGGFGNAHFTSSTRQAPDFAELGEPGENRKVKLELKLVADVGIIGFPSVGKSSFIAAVSAARPKIAAYPFTTLVPHLGVVRVSHREFILCDIPGLIEGASEGRGLGDKFLRHVERCGILVHLLDVGRKDLSKDYKIIRSELKKYSPTLAKKKEIVVLNKIDVLGNDAKEVIASLKKKKIRAEAAISAATTQGTAGLLKKLLPLVLKARKKRVSDRVKEDKTGALPILRPHLASAHMGSFRMSAAKDGTILVVGKRLEQFVQMTNFANAGSRQRFQDVIERIGLLRRIKAARTSDEMGVYVGKVRIDQYL